MDTCSRTAPDPSCPTWGDFQYHTTVCLIVWSTLLSVGLSMGSCRSRWDADKVDPHLTYWVRLFTTNKYYLGGSVVAAFGMCAAHVVRCFRFEDRTPVGNLGAWDDWELFAAIIMAFEAFVLWLHETTKSSEDSARLAASRLLVDSILLPSLIIRTLRGGGQISDFSFSYAASLRLLVLWRTHFDTLPLLVRRSPKMQLVDSLILLVTCMYFMSCLIKQVENLVGPTWDLTSDLATAYGIEFRPRDRWSMTSTAYFVVISMVTVGFRGFGPKSLLGQLAAALVVILGLYHVLRAVLGTARAFESGSGRSSYYSGNHRGRHLVVTGSPSFQVLKDFLLELYHEDHTVDSEGLHVAVLIKPGQRSIIGLMRSFLNGSHRHLSEKVWVIQGSALSRTDLRRVYYKDANAAFLLPNIYAADQEREDIENVMRAMSMRRHSPYIRIITFLLKADHRDLLLAAGIPKADVLCLDEVKHCLFAKTCQTHGFLTVATAFIKCVGFVSDQLDQLPWMDSYTQGIASELYEVDLSWGYKGAPFADVAMDVHKRSNGEAYLIGVIEEPLYPGDQVVVTMFPGRHFKLGTREDRHTKGIFVARRRECIMQHSPHKVFAWYAGSKNSGAEAVANAEASSVTLPNAVPEAGPDGQEGLIQTKQDKDRERKVRVLQSMESAAARRAKQGLTACTDLAADAIADIVGKEALSRDGALDSLHVEDDIEQVQDPVERTLLMQNLLARRAEEELAAKTKAKAEDAAEAEHYKAIKKAVEVLQRQEEERALARELPPAEQNQDNLLWGGPPLPAPSLWRGAQEPPASLLARGGHLLVVALESADTGLHRDDEGEDDEELNLLHAGRLLGIRHFMAALKNARKKRPVVVLAARVPYDWPVGAKDMDLHFVMGQPLAPAALLRAGLLQAHAVVVHQRGTTQASDASAVDSAAIFSCRLATSMLKAAGRDIPVICDLMLESNCPFVTNAEGGLANIPNGEEIGVDPEKEANKALSEEQDVAFHLHQRFVSGQLFVSSIPACMLANMLYNPSLGLMVHELIRASHAVLPVPDEFEGRYFGELVEYFLRRRNMLPLALVRLTEAVALEEEDEEAGPPKTPVRHQKKPAAKVRRWSAEDPVSDRFVFVMPPGYSLVVESDGVMCMMPTASRTVEFL